MAGRKRQRYIVGVDLGGTKIMVGALSEDGSQHFGMRAIPTHAEQGSDVVVDRIVGAIEGVILDTIAETNAARKDFVGIGMGARGPLDRDRGIVVVAPNLGWRDFPPRDLVSNRLGLPATLDNDPNCATVGEWWQGAARGGRTVVGFTIGTGIGGGVIIDGGPFFRGAGVPRGGGHP